MAKPVVIDIETQFLFQEVGFDHRKLKVSVVGTYDYAKDFYRAYTENELRELFTLLEHASEIIGFNINKFDLPVLAPYYVGDMAQFATVDILEEVEKVLGFRISLDDLARATLSTKKSGHGFLAIEYFRKGEWDKLKSYCLQDVRITKNLYEFVQKKGLLYYQSQRGLTEIPLKFTHQEKKKSTVSLSLPF